MIDLIDFYQDNSDSDDIKLSEEINQIILPLKIKALKIGKSKKARSDRKLKVVPVAIRALYPGMSYSTYTQKIKDPLFLYDSVKICQDCYKFTKNVQD